MQKAEITGIPDINALHDQLIKTVNTFHRSTPTEDGRKLADHDCGSVLHDPSTGITTVLWSGALDPAPVLLAIETFKRGLAS